MQEELAMRSSSLAKIINIRDIISSFVISIKAYVPV